MFMKMQRMKLRKAMSIRTISKLSAAIEEYEKLSLPQINEYNQAKQMLLVVKLAKGRHTKKIIYLMWQLL